MNLTRRLFARSAPMATVAGSIALGNTNYPTPAPPPIPYNPGRNEINNAILKAVSEPIGLKKYHEAREAVYKSQRYMNMLLNVRNNEDRGMNLNIQALRSVSLQHKLHMEVMRREHLNQEERTLVDRLIDQFGLRDWFENRKLENGPMEAPSRY